MRFDLAVDVTHSARGDAFFSLTLERPTSGTPVAFGGLHVVTLERSPRSGTEPPYQSQIELAIEVPVSGRADCAAARDVRGDTVLAELPAVRCDVSPLGRFSYHTLYDTGEESPPQLKLLGEITADNSEQGIGFFSIGLHPVQRDTGSWRSEKIE